MIKTIIFFLVFAAAMYFLYVNIKKIYALIGLGKEDNRFDNIPQRIGQMLGVAIFQSKILRFKSAGLVHVGIFWGFLVLMFSAGEAIIQGFYHEFSLAFLGPVYWAITLLTDIFCVIIIVSIIISLIRRYVVRVPRLQGDAEELKDALIVLLAIFTIVTSLLLEISAATHLHTEEWACHPVGNYIGAMIPASSASLIYEIGWWIHILAILAFMNYLPFSKHLHVYTSIQNVYFSTIGPTNKLEKIDFEEEGVEKFGVVDIDDLSWKNIHDSFSCTHCGRCTSVCPAASTGKVLSPREIIVQIRERTSEYGPLLLKKQNAKGEYTLEVNEQALQDKKFVGEYENIEAIWDCTTCGACMQECPINIEHVPAIVGMRRSLVMMEANFPQEVQPAFSNMETNATPWAFSQAERADWAEGTGIKTCAEDPDFEYLFWVGCAGSFDDRAKSVSLAFAKLLQEAGVNFRILGTEEACNGDPARRMGNEYLADMMIKMNLEVLKGYDVKKILTTCPHCFNTFKNEYPDFGGKFEVIHHSQFLKQLIDQGKLKLKAGSEKVAYHDSCYLGRYNEEFDAPRDSIKAIPGLKVLEAGRNRDEGFCCGAGGGRMFMEETKGDRVNEVRTQELLDTNPDTIAANCPFCLTMLTDGVKAKDKVDDVKVKDIAEIILENLA
jgi:Fe-S oxidoreductase/nitrate reductase gamma subunit